MRSIIKLNGNAYGKKIVFCHRGTLFPNRVLAKCCPIVYIHISPDLRINVRYKRYAGTVVGSLWRTTFHPQKSEIMTSFSFCLWGDVTDARTFWREEILCLFCILMSNYFDVIPELCFQGGHLRWTHRAFSLSYQGTGKTDLQDLPIWSHPFYSLRLWISRSLWECHPLIFY